MTKRMQSVMAMGLAAVMGLALTAGAAFARTSLPIRFNLNQKTRVKGVMMPAGTYTLRDMGLNSGVPLVQIRSVVGRCCKPRIDMHYQHGPISTVAGHYAKDILWPNAGVGPEEINLTGSYDAFTFTTMLQLEDYGFCKKGEGGQYVSSGIIELGGKRPNNTSGGHLCEGYTHGMNMVIENVRQLRHDVDDACPVGPDGRRQHTYDYGHNGTCRQVKDVAVTANLGWAMPGTGSAMVMARA